MNKSAIARTLEVHRHTGQKYSALESAPQRKPRLRKASALAPYESYILKRFTDGCHNATQIHKEIMEQGYPGAYNSVARVIQYLKKCEREGKHLPHSPPGLSAAQAKGILITRPEKRMEQQRLTIERMMVDRHVGKCCHLFEEFARLFRDRERACHWRLKRGSPNVAAAVDGGGEGVRDTGVESVRGKAFSGHGLGSSGDGYALQSRPD